MKRSINRLMPILFAGLFLYSGCAKQGVVKSDPPIAPVAAKPAETITAKQTQTSVKSPDKTIATSNTKSASPVNKDPIKSDKTSTAALTADLQKKLEKIFFDFDSFSLSDSARQALTRNFAVLKQVPEAQIRIEGNCDELGSDEYNLALGERRAQAAASYLTTLGISGKRLSTISYGKEKPADPGHDENARAKNRRDDFVITN
ncbi:MAG: peptidoglycan-associated lipoprotein Pal [Geobacteraceae bacterium]|nr:peptidoglycan-associated lipoprotein Pal [Geobacteraceae bacterium]